jgi:hypothetical protein
MHMQKVTVFLFESHLRVVRPLTLYVPNRIRHMRMPDAERSVSILPGETTHPVEPLRNPFGGLAFESLHHVTQGHRRRVTEEEMHMVVKAADLKCFQTMRAANATEVAPDVFFDIGRQPGIAVLGGEDDVDVEGGERIGLRGVTLGFRCRNATQKNHGGPTTRGLKPTATVRDRYAVISLKLDEIGRMVGGWLKSLEGRKS